MKNIMHASLAVKKDDFLCSFRLQNFPKHQHFKQGFQFHKDFTSIPLLDRTSILILIIYCVY